MLRRDACKTVTEHVYDLPFFTYSKNFARNEKNYKLCLYSRGSHCRNLYCRVSQLKSRDFPLWRKIVVTQFYSTFKMLIWCVIKEWLADDLKPKQHWSLNYCIVSCAVVFYNSELQNPQQGKARLLKSCRCIPFYFSQRLYLIEGSSEQQLLVLKCLAVSVKASN